MKVALFGGSFNPVHNGHLRIADELLNKKISDQIWFIPCRNHAFGKGLASGKDRINMLNLAIRDNSNFKIISMENELNKKSFTANTIRTLRRKFSHSFYFVIGADNLKDFEKWHDVHYLQKNVEFILIKRPTYPLPKKIKIKVLKIISLSLKESSTEIRKFVKNKESILKLVPNSIVKYIDQNGLYK